MTELDPKLHGIAVYNPDLLSKEELVAQFVARRELLAHLLEDLRQPGFHQHQIVVGSRGMGKTTLLRRLRFAVSDDSELNSEWLALIFPEEQYNISRLSDLYVNCIDALGDELERSGRRSEAADLDRRVSELPATDEQRRAELALQLLVGSAESLGKRLLLLIDNLDLVLERLEKMQDDQWSLRETLSREKRLLVIGAMPVVIGATYTYGSPFYEFFRIHELHGLTIDETREVLFTLAREMRAPDVTRLVENDPARVRTLHLLAGGNPRTIVLLFQVLAQGTEGDVRTDLERLLDQCTPLYKARFESLPVQAQQVVDALAIHWDPISAGELAELTNMEVNVVSAQLNRLAQQNVVEKVPYDPPTKTGFQIAERFFNIWYLMRASRRVRRRLTWLVQFLRLFYGSEQLQERAQAALRKGGEPGSTATRLRHAEFCLALAEATTDRPLQSALETHAMRAFVEDAGLGRSLSSLFDFEGADAPLRAPLDRQIWAKKFRDAVFSARVEFPGWDRQWTFENLGSSLFTREQKLALAQRLSTMLADEYQEFRDYLHSERQLKDAWMGSFSRKLDRAVCEGYMNSLDDFDGAATAAIALNMPALTVFSLQPDEIRALAQRSGDGVLWSKYTDSLIAHFDYDGAWEAISEGLRAEPCGIVRMRAATILKQLGRTDEAISVLKPLLEGAGEQMGVAWKQLGDLLLDAQRIDESLKAFENALERMPDDSDVRADYARVLALAGRLDESREMAGKVLEKGIESQHAWMAVVSAAMERDDAVEAVKLAQRAHDRFDSEAVIGILVTAQMHANQVDLARAIALENVSRFKRSAPLIAMLFIEEHDWPTARALMAPFLRAVEDISRPDWQHVLNLFWQIAAGGFAADAAQLLAEEGATESLRVIYEALRIHGSGHRRGLKRLAPEVREPVEGLLDVWQSSVQPERAEPKKTRKAARKRRR